MITPVYVPLLGPSQMAPGKAHAMVCERITSMNSGLAREQPGYPLVERHAVFPGRSQRRPLMVFARGRAASMSEKELGDAIGGAIDAGLTKEAFIRFLDWLAAAPGESQFQR